MIVRGAIVHEPALIALAAEPMAGSHAPYLQQPEAFAEEPRPILRRFQPMGTSHVNGDPALLPGAGQWRDGRQRDSVDHSDAGTPLPELD